mmetsp:Transcript_28262/g.66410  ORF Transcript_28262/g.66410 Transcript_28262/m.66410 type:complete len:296 (+) Transcript_28262:2361-3248(+)
MEGLLCHSANISSVETPSFAAAASAPSGAAAVNETPNVLSKRAAASLATLKSSGIPFAKRASCRYCLSKRLLSAMSLAATMPFSTMEILCVVKKDCTNRWVSLLKDDGLMRTSAWFSRWPSRSLCITSCTQLHTSSSPCSALILRMAPSLLNLSTTGKDSCWYVAKRFLIDSKLSSERPLVLPLSSRRASITAAEQSKNMQNFTSTLGPIISFQPCMFSALLGKPSMRYLPSSHPRSSMAFCSRRTTTDTGTSLPSLMWLSINSPSSDPGLFLSSRSKSPADRCWNPKFAAMRAH